MKRFRIALFIGCIAFLVFTTSGCGVFIRLLKVKLQMREFDRYFRVEDQNGIALTFLEPVLRMEDIEWLMRSQAAIQASHGRYALWKYVLKKQYPHAAKTEEGNFDIIITMFFKDGKLHKTRYPGKFSSILGSKLLTGALKSMGTGKLDQRKQSIAATWEDKKISETVRIPVKPDIEKVLGQPFFITRSDTGLRVYYKYKLQSRSSSDQLTKLPVARLWLMYRYGDGRLLSAKSRISGMTALLNFPET